MIIFHLKNLLWSCLIPVILIATVSSPAFSQNSPTKRIISVDYPAIKANHNKFYRKVAGAGRAAEGLRANWQKQLETVQREYGFEYISFHGLLQDEMVVNGEDKRGF